MDDEDTEEAMDALEKFSIGEFDREKSSHKFGQVFVIGAIVIFAIAIIVQMFNQKIGQTMIQNWKDNLLPLVSLVFGFLFGRDT